MQYTQQQPVAPEVPDESALYSPITVIKPVNGGQKSMESSGWYAEFGSNDL